MIFNALNIGILQMVNEYTLKKIPIIQKESVVLN
jgi:hypothetical protein